MKLEAKPKPNSISTMHCLVICSDCWANCVNWVGGGTPAWISNQEIPSLFTTNSNFCGEKVALTQVVEHHLPTYVSLALAWQKGGSENLHEIQNKMKVHRIEKTTNTRHQICRIRKKAMTRGQLRGLENPLQPILSFFFYSHCEAIKSYNFSTSDHHQGMVVVE